MYLLFWGLTISLIGKILLVIGVLKAHSEIAHEHRIDQKVIRTFKTERTITLLGLIFIVAGYLLEIYFYGFTSFFICSGDDCAAVIAETILQ